MGRKIGGNGLGQSRQSGFRRLNGHVETQVPHGLAGYGANAGHLGLCQQCTWRDIRKSLGHLKRRRGTGKGHDIERAGLQTCLPQHRVKIGAHRLIGFDHLQGHTQRRQRLAEHFTRHPGARLQHPQPGNLPPVKGDKAFHDAFCIEVRGHKVNFQPGIAHHPGRGFADGAYAQPGKQIGLVTVKRHAVQKKSHRIGACEENPVVVAGRSGFLLPQPLQCGIQGLPAHRVGHSNCGQGRYLRAVLFQQRHKGRRLMGGAGDQNVLTVKWTCLRHSPFAYLQHTPKEGLGNSKSWTGVRYLPVMTKPGALTLADVVAAQHRLASHIHRTPVLTSRTLDARVGQRVFLKAENFQRGGSFKVRGATNCLATLAPEVRARGVVAFSSGNHAQGVALAARTFGVPATIVMPTDAPAAKVAATRGYGARITTYDRQRDDREALACRLAEATGATVIPPYDHHAIMAGQGTVALELLTEVGPLDALLVPVGGGGLLAGCATVATAWSPDLAVYGVEAELANDTYLSFRAGQRLTIPPPATIADGMRNLTPGRLTFPVLQRTVTDILLVSEDEIRAAVAFLLTRLKVLVEPTGAVGVAALLAGKVPVQGGRVGVILSGGNVDAVQLADCLNQCD